MALIAAKRKRPRVTPPWTGTAFLVEALVLLAFLVAMLALFMALFAGAAERGRQADQLTQAVSLAQNAAERFAADPADAAPLYAQSGLVAQVKAQSEEQAGGTLWHAVITVREAAENSADRTEDAGANPDGNATGNNSGAPSDASGSGAGADAGPDANAETIIYQLETSRYVSAAASLEGGVTS